MIPFRSTSIRHRLTLVLGGAALLAILLAGVAFLSVSRLTLRERVREIMEPYAQLVSVGVETAVVFEDRIRAEEVLSTLRANPQFLGAEIVLREGRRLAVYGRLADWPGPALDVQGLHLTANQAVLLRDLPEGAHLRLVMGLHDLKRQTLYLLLQFAVIALGLVALVTLGLQIALQRTIVRPISTLARTVEQVSARADYQQRVPAAGTDEVSQLGRSFNAMMGVIQERERELAGTNLFRQAVLSNAAYGIVSTTPDGVVSSFNCAAERMLGYTAVEVIGKQTPMCWHDENEVQERAKQLSQELGEPVAAGFETLVARARRKLPQEREWTILRKDGTRIMALLSVSGMWNDSAQLTGFVGLLYDLTERRRADQEIHRLNAELEQRVLDRTAELQSANRELESFSYSVSHDLRAPLRHLDSFVQLLLKTSRSQLNEKAQHYLDNISDSARRMGQLIDDLLRFSRTGRADMHPEEVDMNQLVTEVLLPLREDLASRRIEWVVPDLPSVLGDRALLRQVWANLFDNAAKYTGPRPSARIEVISRKQDGELVFAVADNGVGFDMRYAGKLFRIFQRLHSEAEFPGTGVGLATVRRIVERHGGRVWAESEPDRGATFYFALPARG
jgi:signal transduction histidine kinase/HAMP domain-containing protein